MLRKRLVAVVRGVGAALVVTTGAQAADVRVEFASPLDGATLVGTLTLPEGEAPERGFPAAVFVNATGDHPRDEARSGGSQWKDLADSLAARGVASLRVDARGVGESVSAGVDGWQYRWTTPELAQDARAAIALVRERGEIDGARVGVIAFSDGCSIAAEAARGMGSAPAFAVLLSVSGVPAWQHVLAEQKAQLEMTGATAEQIGVIVPRIEAALQTLMSDAPTEECQAVVAQVILAMGAPEEQANMAAEAAMEELGTRGVRFYLGYDPAAALAGLRGRAVAIVGGADARHGAPGQGAALTDALGADAVETVDGLGHFLEGDAEGVFAPAVVERVAAIAAERTE